MKRLATLVLAASFGLGSLLALGHSASATPFSDVPANHWAYQAIQSLAADGLVEGYPDGKFKGDRPLTRYEMAVLVARVIAKLQANGAGYASKADLDKLQKLIDALKDELDSLGVRVTNLEDALNALDARTKFAQSIQLHGSILDNNSFRQRYGVPQTIAHGAIDPFVNVFLTSPANNSPLEAAGSGNLIRFDDKLNLTYTINENLTVSIPIHIINYDYGGEFTPQAKYSIQPDVVVNIARIGALTNVYFRDGQLDNLKSSRLGLTYRAPDATQQGPGYENPVQPYEKGFEIGGILGGLTQFQFAFTRIDQSMINTLTNVADPSGEFSNNNYFYIVDRPQTSYIQPGAPNSAAGASRTDRSRALAAKATLTLAIPVRDEFVRIKLVAPLKKSLAEKRKAMEAALKAYEAAADYQVADVTTAATFDAMVGELRAGKLDHEVPAHGTLVRVRRSVGLRAPRQEVVEQRAAAREARALRAAKEEK